MRKAWMVVATAFAAGLTACAGGPRTDLPAVPTQPVTIHVTRPEPDAAAAPAATRAEPAAAAPVAPAVAPPEREWEPWPPPGSVARTDDPPPAGPLVRVAPN